MKSHKIQIQSRFNQASKSYKKVALIQRECAQILSFFLIEKFPDFRPASILDLGAGTGFLTEFLVKKFPSSKFTLNDIAPNMIEKLKENFSKKKNFNFHLGDLETSFFGNFDLIVSNFALQWVDNLETCLSKFFFSSKILAFSCLLNGTFESWEAIFVKKNLPSPIKKYPTCKDLTSFLKTKRVSFFSKKLEFELIFPNAFSFMKYLKKLGASSHSENFSFKDLKSIIKNYNQEIKTSYKIFLGIIKKIE